MSHPSTQIAHRHLLRPVIKPPKRVVDTIAAPKDKTLAATEDAVVCRECLHVITSSSERKIIDGAHAHTFANPQGIVFEIVCYQDAWGCGTVGPASSEFTWFAGYVWRVAVCAQCHVHLGWRFSAPDGYGFNGLIADRLIVKDA